MHKGTLKAFKQILLILASPLHGLKSFPKNSLRSSTTPEPNPGSSIRLLVFEFGQAMEMFPEYGHALDEITYNLVPQLAGGTAASRTTSFRLGWLLNGYTPDSLDPKLWPTWISNGELSEPDFSQLRFIWRNICTGGNTENPYLSQNGSTINGHHAGSVQRCFDVATRQVLRKINLDIGGRSLPEARWLIWESDTYFQQASLAATISMLAPVAANYLPYLQELTITMPWHIKTNNESFRRIMETIIELPNLQYVEIRRTNDHVFRSNENRMDIIPNEDNSLLYRGAYVWRGDALEIWQSDCVENDRLQKLIKERKEKEKADEEMLEKLRIG